MLPPPASSTSPWLSGWVVAPVPLGLAVLLAAGYVLAARRRSGWPPSRTAWFLLVGVGSLLAVTQSWLGESGRAQFWPLAVQDVLLVTVVPLGLTLGRPLELWGRRARLPRVLHLPLVGSVLGTGVLTALYVTGWDLARLESPALFAATQVLLLAAGCAFLWPLVGLDQGTGTTSYPVRTLVAFLDSLLDAVPGLAILGTGHVIAASYYRTTSTHEQVLGGTLMIGLAELVGLPTLLLLAVGWVRSDAREAAVVDAHLDARTPAPHPGSGRDDPESVEPELTRPWWETEPGRLGERYRRGPQPRG